MGRIPIPAGAVRLLESLLHIQRLPQRAANALQVIFGDRLVACVFERQPLARPSQFGLLLDKIVRRADD